jgi:hypothetical protein
VSSKYLQGHDSCVLHQVVYHPAVEDLQTTVVTSISEERQTTLVEANSADSFFVESKSLVGLVGELEIVPEET